MASTAPAAGGAADRSAAAKLPRRARGGQRGPEAAHPNSAPVVGSLASVAIASAAAVGWFRSEHDRLGPAAYLRSGRGPSTGAACGVPRGRPVPVARRPVVCLGDGITRGSVCSDWVERLQRQLGDTPVVNAGVNLDGAQDLCRRLDSVLRCQPSHVVVLVGTDDIKADLYEFEGWMYELARGRSGGRGLEPFEQALVELRDRLLESGAQVALASPPVLGEDPWSSENRRAAVYAATVRRVAEERGCLYIPLFERGFALLPLEGGMPYDGARFLSWMSSAIADGSASRSDFGQVQEERGLSATVDLVHPSEQVSQLLVETAAAFARGSYSAPKAVRYQKSDALLQREAAAEAPEVPEAPAPARQRRSGPGAAPQARRGSAAAASAQQKLTMQGVVRTLRRLGGAGRGRVPVASLRAEFEALWKVPFPLEDSGEAGLVAFLRAWPRKVDVIDVDGTPCVQLAGAHAVPTRLARKAAREAELR